MAMISKKNATDIEMRATIKTNRASTTLIELTVSNTCYLVNKKSVRLTKNCRMPFAIKVRSSSLILGLSLTKTFFFGIPLSH